MKLLYLLLLTIVFFLLGGCANSPPAHYYHLTVENQPSSTLKSKNSFLLQPVRIAEVLKRDYIVSYDADKHKIIVSNTHLWGSDLREMFLEVIVSTLKQRLPEATIFAQPAPHKFIPQYTLSIQVEEFSGQVGGKCTLRANWVVINENEQIILNKTEILEKMTTDDTYTNYVATLNSLLNEFLVKVSTKIDTLE